MVSSTISSAYSPTKLSSELLPFRCSEVLSDKNSFAWIDSGVFIMYVPYGTSIKDPNGNIISRIDQPWCESNLKDESYLGTLMICDAPGGMARIYNAGTISAATKDLAPTTPQGYDKSFNVISNENFNVTNAIRGSVASWRAGDFGYDAASPFQDVLSSGQPLSEQLATALANLHIGPETAGFFNIPVCGVYDLRFFPPAVGVTQTDCGFYWPQPRHPPEILIIA